MRAFIAMIVGVIGGFVLGVALSSIIGIISVTIFRSPYGIKFLPYYMAVLCAIVVPIVDARARNDNRRSIK